MTSVNYILVTGYFVTVTFISLHHVLKLKMEELTSNTEPVISFHKSIPTTTQPNSQFTETNFNHNPPRKQLQWYFKVYFLLFQLVITFCTQTAVVYWTALFPIANMNRTSYGWYIIVDRHGLNLILVLLEFALNRAPVRLLHSIYCAVFLVLYIVYNAIYWSVTKEFIYGNVLNYEKYLGFVIGIIFGGTCLVLPLTQLLGYIAFHLRTRLSDKLNLDDKTEELKTEGVICEQQCH